MKVEDYNVPVNKQAALVTSQAVCVDDYFIYGNEKLKALGKQKRHFADLSHELKREMGIKGKFSKNFNVPPHIYKHKKFPILKEIMAKLTDIEKEIAETKEGIKGNRDQQVYFIRKVKERYPEIYKEIYDLMMGRTSPQRSKQNEK